MKVKVKTMVRRGRAVFTHGKIVECTERDGVAFLRYGLAEKVPAGAQADGSLIPRKGKPERAVAPGGEVTDPGTEPARCTGETKQGNPCKRYAAPGSDRCDRHPA